MPAQESAGLLPQAPEPEAIKSIQEEATTLATQTAQNHRGTDESIDGLVEIIELLRSQLSQKDAENKQLGLELAKAKVQLQVSALEKAAMQQVLQDRRNDNV